MNERQKLSVFGAEINQSISHNNFQNIKHLFKQLHGVGYIGVRSDKHCRHN